MGRAPPTFPEIERVYAENFRVYGALAESIIGLYKTEVIRRRGPWRHVEAVPFATSEWVDWFNNRRLLEPIGNVPPAEFERAYYGSQATHAMAA